MKTIINEKQLRNIISETIKNVLENAYNNINDNDIDMLENNYDEVVVPEHCLNYLVNGDLEGYSNKEIQLMQAFERKWQGKLRNNLRIGDICVPMDNEEPSFTRSNDIYGNVGCNCYTFIVPLK